MKQANLWVGPPGPAANALSLAIRAGGGSVAECADANVIVWAGGCPAELQAHLSSQVEWVQLASAGVEQWAAARLFDTNRLWTAAKGAYATPIAEYVVAMMLAHARRLHDVVSTPGWREAKVESISGRCVGIVGAGGVGRATLRLLEPFGVHSIALTRSGGVVPGADESFGTDGLDYLLRTSDYVVLAAPATMKTAGLITARRLARMPRHAFLINVGRGTLIDTAALVEAIAGGRLGGAALDVTDPEPLPDGHPLWSLPNTFVTSHSACPPEVGWALLARRVIENIRRFRSGEPLLGIVDPAAGY